MISILVCLREPLNFITDISTISGIVYLARRIHVDGAVNGIRKQGEKLRFVTGHEFTRAVTTDPNQGFSPCKPLRIQFEQLSTTFRHIFSTEYHSLLDIKCPPTLPWTADLDDPFSHRP